MKILITTRWYPSKENPVKGIFIREQARAVLQDNQVIVFISGDPEPLMKKKHQIDEDKTVSPPTIHLRYRKSPLPKTSFLIHIYGAFAALGRLLREGFKPDIIHAHIYSSGIVALPLAKRYKIPLVISEHSSEFHRGQICGIEKLKAKLAFSRASLVCPVSEDMKSEIESLGIKARFRIVPNAVDTSLFFPTESQQTGEINRDRKYILLVALLTPIKGVPVLLKALASLKNKREDFILDIVGDGPNRTEYEGLTRRLGLKDFVRFHGLRPKEEVAEFMKRCAFLVLPSHHETFGTVLVEALSCGKPVIATDRGGPKEIVSEDAGLLIPPDQPEVLVESIDYMLDHFPAYNPKKISEYAHSRYSLEAVGREWNRLYRNLTKNHV